MGMRLRRAGTAVASAVLAIGAVVGPAQASAASTPTSAPPATAGGAPAAILVDEHKCGVGSTAGNIETCIDVEHSASLILTAGASANVLNTGRRLQICLRGPNGPIGCTPRNGFELVAPGNAVSFSWTPNADEATGNYCANLYRDNGDGTKTQLAHYCVASSVRKVKASAASPSPAFIDRW